MHWNSSNISLEKADFQDAIFLGSFVLISYHESAQHSTWGLQTSSSPLISHTLSIYKTVWFALFGQGKGNPRSQGKVFHGHSIFLLLLLFSFLLTIPKNHTSCG